MIYAPTPSCFCVTTDPLAQIRAVMELLRPQEVRHLVRPVPDLRYAWNRADTVAERVALFLVEQRRNGTLRYFSDPPECDRWCSPAQTLNQGGGDCDDLSLLAGSLLLAFGLTSTRVVIGTLCWGWRCEGHAWVEGRDEKGHFVLEATSGAFHRRRPPQYRAKFAANKVGAVSLYA